LPACVDQGDCECGAPTDLERTLVAVGVFICFGQDVCDLNRPPVDDGAPWDALTHERYRVLSNGTWHTFSVRGAAAVLSAL